MPTPEYDETTMRDEALVEGAAEDAVPEGVKIAELADLDFQGDARAAANDLSLADGRFAPDILEVAARRAVGAWAQGIDGDRGDLESIADGGVVQELLHPGDPSGKTRLVVRGPRVRGDPDRQARRPVRAADDAARGPARGAPLHRGSRHDRDRRPEASRTQSQFTEHWTMGLTDDKEQPWRIIAVGTPARA